MDRHYFKYEEGGRITGIYRGMESTLRAMGFDLDNLTEGEADMDTQYVMDGELRQRPACPAYLDGNVLRGLVPTSYITINGREYVCDDVEAELEVAQPGTYSIRVVSPWPYLIGEFTYENNP